jgi:hypothetical protein
MSKVYICTGACHGVATEAQHQNGATTCGAETCKKQGESLEPRIQCEACEVAGPNHACENCTTPE